MNRTEAAKIVQKDMLNLGVFQSCWNCENFDRVKDSCDTFAMKPPTEVIVYSCGNAWVLYIPF